MIDRKIQANTDGSLTIASVQDCTPVLEATNDLRRHGVTGSKEFRHAASFPMVVVEKYCAQHGISFHEWMANPFHVKAMLNDPDLKGFRVWEGRA